MGEVCPQDVANTAWAFATVCSAVIAFFATLARVVTQRLGEFIPQDFANTAWAFATGGLADTALFATLTKKPSSAGAKSIHRTSPTRHGPVRR